jgi:hypothetical protein
LKQAPRRLGPIGQLVRIDIRSKRILPAHHESRLPVLGVIREIDIWRVAVLMVKRYVDEAEANAD